MKKVHCKEKNCKLHNNIFTLNLTSYEICVYTFIALNNGKKLTITDIEINCNISKNKIYKILSTLISSKLIEKLDKNKYSINFPTTNYFPVPKNIFYNNLDSYEITVLLYFLKLQNFKRLFPNQNTIAKTLKISRSKVNKVISSLCKKGFLVKFRRFKQTSIYKLILNKFHKKPVKEITSQRQYKKTNNNIINNIIISHKKHSAKTKNRKNYTVPEKIFYFLKDLKENFDKKYKTNLSMYFLKELFIKKGNDTIILYLDNLDKFLKFNSIKNIAAYFYKIVKNEYKIPKDEQINYDDTIQEEINFNCIEYNYALNTIENNDMDIEYTNDFITLIKQRRYDRFNSNKNAPSTS